MLFATTLFALTSEERMASQIAADKAAYSWWQSIADSAPGLLTFIWWGWPFFILLLAIGIWHMSLVSDRRSELREQAATAHRNEMQRMDKLLEMHKAGMKVTDDDGPPSATPEPPREVASEPKHPA